jgi:hypothetical protein
MDAALALRVERTSERSVIQLNVPAAVDTDLLMLPVTEYSTGALARTRGQRPGFESGGSVEVPGTLVSHQTLLSQLSN